MDKDNLDILTLDDIIRWIVRNSEDEVTMDKINRLTFAFTSKYKSFTKTKDQDE